MLATLSPTLRCDGFWGLQHPADSYLLENSPVSSTSVVSVAVFSQGPCFALEQHEFG